MFDLMTYLNLHGSQVRTIFGAWNTGLGHGDFLYLDYVLYECNKTSKIIELGTMHGLTTLYLGAVASLREGWAESYDIQNLIPPHIRATASLLGVRYLSGDVLSDERIIAEIRSKLSAPDMMLFCDNGKKQREVELYAPHMVSGGVLLVHDWMKEIFPEGVAPYLGGFTPIRHDVAEAMSSHLRAWIKE